MLCAAFLMGLVGLPRQHLHPEVSHDHARPGDHAHAAVVHLHASDAHQGSGPHWEGADHDHGHADAIYVSLSLISPKAGDAPSPVADVARGIVIESAAGSPFEPTTWADPRGPPPRARSKPRAPPA
jgi:hypothetical protein